MLDIHIFGSGGHGKVAASIAELIGYKKIYLYDDSYKDCTPWCYSGDLKSFIAAIANNNAFVAIGDCTVRQNIAQQAKRNQGRLTNLIHPGSIISKHASLGWGVMVNAGAIINPFATIGDGVIVNTSATIGHDCEISDFVHIAPGAALGGTARVMNRAWVGINSTLKQGVVIGEDSIVGAGSVVIADIPNGKVAYGNPAKIVRGKLG